MSRPVDVLVLIRRAEDVLHDERLPAPAADLRAARAVIAELIAAATEASKDAAILGMTTNRLTAALAACGGVPYGDEEGYGDEP